MTPRALVIGAGPAGMSAAVWLGDLGVPFRWVDDRDEPGGTLRRVGNVVDDFLGGPLVPGHELAALLAADCTRRGLVPEPNTRVRSVRTGGFGIRVHGDEGVLFDGPAVILCTGTHPRRLGLAAEQTHMGMGVEISVTQRRGHYRGCNTVVIGGGDAALEGALLLSKVARHVTLVHRGAEFRGQPRFAEEIAGTENIRVLPSRTVTEIHTVDDGVTGVSLSDGSRVEATGVFVRIGVDPRIPEGLSAIRGSDGYVVADVQGRTPVTGVYAAGDVCSRDHQSVSWAIGSAGRAVRAIYNDIAYRLDLDERD